MFDINQNGTIPVEEFEKSLTRCKILLPEKLLNELVG